jgi:hypothetical protein
MSADMLQLISMVVNPILIRLYAYVLVFVLIISIKSQFPKE